MTVQTQATSEFVLPDLYETDRRSPVRWILSHSVHHIPTILIAVIGALSNAVLAGVGPVLIGQAFNAVMAAQPQTDRLFGLALLIGVTQVSRALLQLARNFGFELTAQRIERNIRNELYVSLLGKSMTFHSRYPVGETMARATNDVREVNFLYNPGLNMVIGSLSFLFVPIILAPRYHPTLILTPLIFVAIYFYTLRQYLNTLRPVTNEVRASFGKLNARLTEALDGIEIVKGSSQETAESKRFNDLARRFRDASVRQGEIEARFLPLLFLSIAAAIGLAHAMFLAYSGLLQVGDVVAYFGLLLMLDFPTFAAMWAYSQISSGISGARRILELLNREENLDQNLSGYTGPMKGEIEFRDVCFSYSDTDTLSEDDQDRPREMLEHITFKVKAGQTVAIVGQTGSGKTTLIKMVNRTYDVDCGQVLVDQVDVRDWNLEALRKGISIIEQDVFLFSRPISENIAFGKPDASPQEVRQAATMAQAHDFIETFEEDYDTVIGERGVTLSGGQRQRVALSRAFLTDPAILILDDSTSAIDSATEDKIQQAIFAAAQGRTTLIITHRLSQIRWADLIIVMRKGRIAAVGTHEELMETSEAYRRIFSET